MLKYRNSIGVQISPWNNKDKLQNKSKGLGKHRMSYSGIVQGYDQRQGAPRTNYADKERELTKCGEGSGVTGEWADREWRTGGLRES